jgi:hypothetical protein
MGYATRMVLRTLTEIAPTRPWVDVTRCTATIIFAECCPSDPRRRRPTARCLDVALNHEAQSLRASFLLWSATATRQAGRVYEAVIAGSPLTDSTPFDRAAINADSQLFVIALALAERSLGALADVVDADSAKILDEARCSFVDEVPGFRQVRNILEHIDKYIQGIGREQTEPDARVAVSGMIGVEIRSDLQQVPDYTVTVAPESGHKPIHISVRQASMALAELASCVDRVLP